MTNGSHFSCQTHAEISNLSKSAFTGRGFLAKLETKDPGKTKDEKLPGKCGTGTLISVMPVSSRLWEKATPM